MQLFLKTQIINICWLKMEADKLMLIPAHLKGKVSNELNIISYDQDLSL